LIGLEDDICKAFTRSESENGKRIRSGESKKGKIKIAIHISTGLYID